MVPKVREIYTTWYKMCALKGGATIYEGFGAHPYGGGGRALILGGTSVTNSGTLVFYKTVSYPFLIGFQNQDTRHPGMFQQFLSSSVLEFWDSGIL